MDIKKIRDFINDNLIFNKGLDFYDRSTISGYIYQNNIIEATISGESLNPYIVQIKLDSNGNPRNAFCSCSKIRKTGVCKHISAVLIYELEQNKTVYNPVNQTIKAPNEVVIKLKETKKDSGSGVDIVKYFSQATALPREINPERRYKLVFVLNYADSYSGKKWFIRPAVRYIKKSGDDGRIEAYSNDGVTESFSKIEKQLLYKLRDRTGIGDELINQIDFLLENDISSILEKDGLNYEPVSFVKINSIYVDFVIDGIRDKDVTFTPEISFTGSNKKFVMGNESYYRFSRSGFSFLIIGNEGKIFFSKNNEPAVDLLILLIHKKRTFVYNDIKRLRSFARNKKNGISISNVLGELKLIDCVPKPFIEIEEKIGSVNIELWFCYDGADVSYNSEREYIYKGKDDGRYTAFRRNYQFERDVFQFLKVKLKTFAHYDFFYQIFSVPTNVTNFLVKHGAKILDENIELRLKGSKNKISPWRGNLTLRLNSDLDWFDVKVGYQDTEGNVNSISFDWSLLSSGLIKAGDSYVLIKEEDIKKLRSLRDEGMNENGELKVSKFHYHFIDEFYQDMINIQNSDVKQARKISSKLKDFKKIKNYSLPRKFNGVLRDYQYEGFKWLFFLHDHNINGCLADDMGLGKTVQTLAFLLKLKEVNKLGAALVVVPVNTLANWESEINRFTPGINYLLHYGAARGRKLEDIHRYDFILSTYHTLRNDIEIFKEISFNYIVLDESQSIKNANTMLFKTMRILRSRHRITLTGTPIENSTVELWSQMEFLNPGILGRRTDFSKRFAVPIENRGDKDAAQKLKHIIYPFLLRRKKEDVARELPDKTEITLYSQMGEEQSSIYEEHRIFYRNAIMGKIEKDGLKNSAIEIFSALLKLRQIALFPVLTDTKFKNIQSCKFMQLKDMVEEILQENHKIVIFSQFVKCLDIIKKYFKRKNLNYSYIDGSLNAGKRKEEINTFQENADRKIFLLSLKAGGVGINLTSADYVFLFDPWWNPAVENQAVDRLHRIGQSRKVMAYKMIVKNTVEEKILELQERKKKLVSQLITTESSFFKSLDINAIASLFEAM